MGLGLFFLPNFPGATFIQGAKFIPDSIIKKYYKILQWGKNRIWLLETLNWCFREKKSILSRNFQSFGNSNILLNDHYSTLKQTKHLLENQKCFLLWAAQRVFSNAGIVSKVSLRCQASEDEGVSVGRLLRLDLDAVVAGKLRVFFKPSNLEGKKKVASSSFL